MDLDELQSIQNRERQTDSLQSLRGSFYEEVGEYVQHLREERERVAAEEGFDAPEFRRLSDEIDTAEDTVESIYERRVGKIVKAASFAAAGMPADDAGLTDEEEALFDQLVSDIEGNREYVLDVLAGETDPTGTQPDEGTPDETPPAPDPTGDDRTTGVDAADVMGGGGAVDQREAADEVSGDAPNSGVDRAETAATASGEGATGATDRLDPPGPTTAERSPDGGPDDGDGASPARSPDEAADVDRATVLITRDVGEILGVDQRAYDLGRDDVVDLPEANATPLLERDAAERLE